MRLSGMVLVMAASAVASMPAFAAGAPVGNPAAPLSLSSTSGVMRAATPSKRKSALAGSALVIAVVAGLAVAAGVVVAATEDNSASS